MSVLILFMQNTPPKQLLSVKEAAELLSVSRKVIWRLIRNGDLPSANLGRKLTRVRAEDLGVFIDTLFAQNNTQERKKTQDRSKKGLVAQTNEDQDRLDMLKRAGLL